ncbi:MAG: cytochrome c maturation protein CcmE domain-containing protein [Promethearchaeota archaeon]
MKKSKIIALAGIAISVVVIVSLIVVNSRPYLQVSQVATNPTRYHNREVQVIGIVQGFSGGNFNLTENEHSILIDINGLTIPNDLDNDVKVVVTGVFDASLVITATQILTQCS